MVVVVAVVVVITLTIVEEGPNGVGKEAIAVVGVAHDRASGRLEVLIQRLVQLQQTAILLQLLVQGGQTERRGVGLALRGVLTAQHRRVVLAR